MLDAAILSRLQFAFTVSYHIIFPSITIGLALFIAVWEGLWLKTGDLRYLQLAKFWMKPFAITFGMGVVSGVVLSYQFGTNFAPFSELVGAVLGPLLTWEVLTAFFLEAGFLGVMLFGWQRVSPRVHFLATCTVAVGTVISAFWILAANSWMHTPAGYAVEAGRYVPVDWWQVIFNPSFPYRLAHMLLAAMLTATFVVAGVMAWYLLQARAIAFARLGLSMALWAGLVLVPVQILVGDLHGLNVKEHQPIKLAAMEGIWEAREVGSPLRLFAWPDSDAETNRFEIAIPQLASLILEHRLNAELTGLKAVPADERPNVPVVFFAFRIMLAIGGLMLLAVLWGAWLRRRGTLFSHPRYLRFLRWMTPSGVVATLAGWYVVEVGRQPWLVQGLVRTHEVVSPLPAERVAFSLLLFVIVYSLLFGVYLHFFRKLVRKGPPDVQALQANRSVKVDPVSAATPARLKEV